MAGVNTEESADDNSSLTGSRVDQWIKQQEDQVCFTIYLCTCTYPS